MEQHQQQGTKCAARLQVRGNVTPIATPIYATSTYLLASAEHGARLSSRGHFHTDSETDFSTSSNDNDNNLVEDRPWLYTRWGNPTVDVVSRLVANLEGGFGGHTFSSGMAAITTTLFALLKAGDHVVSQESVYGGTHELFSHVLPSYHIQVTFVDGSNISNFRDAIQPNTKVLYAETPSNPLMKLVDLEALGVIGKEHHAVTVVDSTFASPHNQNPIKYGIDVVIHSATKYIGGHADLMAGIVVSANETLHEQIFHHQKLFGGILSPFDAFLVIRGIKTLEVRMMRHNQNALKISQFLSNHPKVVAVHYPGLESHPQHELANRQMARGSGGMLSFEVIGGLEGGRKLIESVKLINLAVSLGGVESLIEQPATMTHQMVPRSERQKQGIADGLVRLSVGIESADDLISDLAQALENV